MAGRVLPVTLACLLAACGSGGNGARAEQTRPAAAPPSSSTAPARAAAGVRLKKVGSFSSPVFVTQPPGDARRLFVVEQGGRVRVVRDGRVLARPFLDVSKRIVSGGEQGLLSMAFAPDYQHSGRLYVFFTNKSGDEEVDEYRRASADRAGTSARRVLVQPDHESNHNGGLVLFGPDGKLYVGLGDGGGAGDQHGAHGNGQNLGTLLGKILRIDPRRSGHRAYTVPRDNPFVGRSGVRPEIWAYGLRNPWRFSFDRQTGDLVIGDVGQDAVEEIDFAPAGRGGQNYGWRAFEGDQRYDNQTDAPGAVAPVLVQRHTDGYCSITGGYVVRDPALAGLEGQYVYGDFCHAELRAAKVADGAAHEDRGLGINVGSTASFGEDAAGHVYVVSLNGPVSRLVAG